MLKKKESKYHFRSGTEEDRRIRDRKKRKTRVKMQRASRKQNRGR